MWLGAFVLLVSLTIDFSTDTPYVPGRWLGPFYRLGPATQWTSATCAAVLCLFALLPLIGTRQRDQAVSGPHGGVALALRLLPLPSMLFAFFWSRPHVGPRLAIPWNIFIAAAAAFFVLGAVRRSSPIRIAALAALVGIALRLIHFSRFSIDVGGDMLPLTRSALDSFLAGRSPYNYHHVPDLLPLTYYPLTWLAYLPAYLLHIDLRWTNLVAELAIPAAVLHAGRRPREREAQAAGDSAGSALLLWSFVFLLPSSVFFDRITTAPVGWALLAWTLAVAIRGSRWDWLLAGLLAAATPLAALPALFLVLTWWRQHSRGKPSGARPRRRRWPWPSSCRSTCGRRGVFSTAPSGGSTISTAFPARSGTPTILGSATSVLAACSGGLDSRDGWRQSSGRWWPGSRLSTCDGEMAAISCLPTSPVPSSPSWSSTACTGPISISRPCGAAFWPWQLRQSSHD